MRVVSLNCSNTEIVCALGCAGRLVGVDTDSDHPADVVAALPRVGRDLDIDIQKVQALAPDLVLGSDTVPGHDKVLARLAASGLRFYAPETITLEDVYADIREIGGRLGVVDRAETLVSAMRAAMPPVAAGVDAPRVLIEWWPKPPIAAGRRSWVHDLIELAGGRNALGDRDVKSTPLEDDEIAAIDPQAVVISWCGVPREKYRPREVYKRVAWQNVAAVRDREVHCVAEACLGRPGPRVVEGYGALRGIIERLRAGSA